jgi:putative polyketide hydroxylase
MLRQAIGLPDVEITLLPPIPGRPAKVAHSAAGGGGSVAHRFRQGRIFLVGDAAHVVPPTGSYGASTGIADAHNLAWKLTSVLNGHAGPGLLDTYEEERRPVARTTLYHAMSLLQARMSGGDEDNEVTDDITMMFGYRYESSAVRLEAETDIPVQDPRTHTGEPGLRAPHVWLEQRGKRFSTTELCTEFWSLLIGPDGGQWEEAGKSVAAELGVDLRTCRIGAELRDPDDRLLDCYGITAAGCSLVRPDGFVAWRHQAGSAHAEPTLRCVIANLLSLTACR